MRNVLESLRVAARTSVRAILGLQGVAGVACLAVGSVLLWGPGVALLIVGVFLLLGAWGNR